MERQDVVVREAERGELRVDLGRRERKAGQSFGDLFPYGSRGRLAFTSNVARATQGEIAVAGKAAPAELRAA